MQALPLEGRWVHLQLDMDSPTMVVVTMAEADEVVADAGAVEEDEGSLLEVVDMVHPAHTP